MNRLVDLHLAEIGCAVWERQLEGAQYDPRGGTVVAIDTMLDGDTGELKRVFVCYDTPHGKLRRTVLPEDSVGSVEPPNNAFIRSLIRKAAEHVYRSKGPFDSGVIDAIDLQRRLVAVVMGG
jgi:hypothetical protein